MNYQVLNLIQPYLAKNNLIFASLVNKDWQQIINKENYKTPYSVLTTKSLLSYSVSHLQLVINEKVKEVIIKLGNVDTIKYLHTKTDIIDPKYLNYAARHGHLEIIIWLKNNGCEFGQDTFCIAAQNGNLRNMKWLFENGCQFSQDIFCIAAKNGSLCNMKWLLDNGCPFDDRTFGTAVKNGNLCNMKWLKANGCEFSHNTFEYAAQNGNLENMKWLKDNGCPQ